MSYQPESSPPGLPWQTHPAVVQGEPSVVMPTPAPVKKSSLGKLGALLALLGLVGGGVLFFLSRSQPEEAVKKLARAAIGCTTTLEFDGAGTFTFYVETKGSIGEVSGGCNGGGSSYSYGDGAAPRPTLTLADDNRDNIRLSRTDTPTYSRGAFAGMAVRTAEITKAGTYQLTVESDTTDFAIAIGREDPNHAGDLMKKLAIACAAGGLVLGGLLMLLGRNRAKQPAAAAPSTAAPPAWSPAPPPANQPPMYAPAQPPAYEPPPTYAVPPTYTQPYAQPTEQYPTTQQYPAPPPRDPGWAAPKPPDQADS